MDAAFLERLCKNLSDYLGAESEIVIHDFRNGLDHTVTQICNPLTGRKVGDAPTSLFFESFDLESGDCEDLPCYFTELPDGRLFKSSTTFLRENGRVTGAICINTDVSELRHARQRLDAVLGGAHAEKKQELFVSSLEDLMEYHLSAVELRAGKAAKEMTRAEKLEALRYLDEKGVLHMAKANVRLCEFFDFSKYTLYSYLDEIRKAGLQE